MDDFTNNRSTTGILELSSAVSGELEITRDVDWFHANLTGWVEIRIEALDSGEGSLENPVLKSIFAPDDNGRKVQFVDNNSGTGRDSTLRLLVDHGDLYLAVAAIAGGTGSYRIIAESFGDHADSFSGVPSSLLFGQTAHAEFETGTDRDLFRTELLRFNRQYEIQVDVDQYLPGSNNWQISVYDQNQVLRHQVSEDASQIKFMFSPATDGQYFVSVDSIGKVGEYDFEINPIDDQTGVCGESICGGQHQQAPLPLNGSELLGDIETWTDIDYFLSEAWAGGYYVLSFGPFDDVNQIGLTDYVIHFEQNTDIETHTLAFAGNVARQFEVIPKLNADFEIDVKGDAFADGKFEISILETPPITIAPKDTHPTLMFLPVDGGIPIESLIEHMGVLDNVPDTWQFWHQPGNPQAGDTGYLSEDGQLRASNEIHTVVADDFADWLIHPQDANPNTISGSDEIFVRAAYKGIFTPWLRIDPQIETIDSGTQSEAAWDENVISFSFMNELPAYLGGFSDFEALSSSFQDNVRSAMTEWDRVGAFQLVEVADSDSVDIRIGSAAFSAAAFTHAAGPGDSSFSGDILLNTEHYNIDFTAGDQLFQRLMRGVGIALGLNDIPDGSITVADSILRTYSIDGVFPYQPMRLDHLFIKEKYGLDTGTNSGNDRYLLSPGSTGLVTIFDSDGYDTIDAALYQDRVHISIHEGGKITTPDGTRWVGYGTSIERLNGGQGDDFLAGNELDNKVTGRAGNDFIYGRQGNDVMLGGQGDDRYGYRLGDGNDIIFEQGKGGRDVLHIQTPLSLNNSFLGYENIMFTRDANDLLLDFTNSPHRIINDTRQTGPSDGSIRIRDMGSPSSAIEVLRLDDGYHQLQTPVISLESIFGRLADGQSSFFKISGINDQWGVVPDFAFPSV